MIQIKWSDDIEKLKWETAEHWENTLSDSLEVEPLTQMHLNATGGKREEEESEWEKEKKRGGVGENVSKKHREVKRDNKAAGKEK